MEILHGARGRLTTRFWEDIGRGFPHRGIDIGHGGGRPDDLAIVAPAAGKVTAVGRDGTYGYRIIIDHGGGWSSLLAHLSAWTVHEGDQVARGDLIATMGNTGTVYVHLHQELRYRGAVVDPELHITPTTLPTEEVEKIAERIIAVADFSIQAIEQNQTPEGPNHLRIALYGPGMFVVIEPSQRDTYKGLRAVTAQASKDMGGTFLLPENATSVDAQGWASVENVFGRFAA